MRSGQLDGVGPSAPLGIISSRDLTGWLNSTVTDDSTSWPLHAIVGSGGAVGNAIMTRDVDSSTTAWATAPHGTEIASYQVMVSRRESASIGSTAAHERPRNAATSDVRRIGSDRRWPSALRIVVTATGCLSIGFWRDSDVCGDLPAVDDAVPAGAVGGRMESPAVQAADERAKAIVTAIKRARIILRECGETYGTNIGRFGQ